MRSPEGSIVSLAFGNGRSLSRTFNLGNEPLEVHSGPLWLTYTPTPGGDIGYLTDQSEDPAGCLHGVSRSLSYDFQGRLAGWSDAVQTGTGICAAESLGAMAAAFTYVEGTDQIASQRAPDLNGPPVLAFGYDRQGNVSAIGRYDAAGTSIASAVCLRHDALGRLVTVGSTTTPLVPGGTACLSDAEVTATLARFKYDARNRRIARQVGGEWTYVVADGSGRPLSELALVGGAWSKVRDYVWLDGFLLAQVEYVGATAHRYFAHVDHLGTPRALTNANGQAVWRSYQRPFAEVGESAVPDPLTGRTVVTNLRLPGQYDERLLGSLGLQGPDYNWNRWYLPGLGRYLEVDPLALNGGFNSDYGVDWYGYAWQNPLRWSDPSALVPCGLGDTTYTCCLKKFPGCPECCGGETPPLPPATPGRAPKLPEPPPTCPTTGQPPPPDVPPMPPGTGCKAMFDVCMGWAASSPSVPGRAARAAGCMAAYIACLARGG